MWVDRHGKIHQKHRRWYSKLDTDQIYANGGQVILHAQGCKIDPIQEKPMKVIADFMQQDDTEPPHLLTIKQYTVESSEEVIATLNKQLALAATIWPCLDDYEVRRIDPIPLKIVEVSKDDNSTSKRTSKEVNSAELQNIHNNPVQTKHCGE